MEMGPKVVVAKRGEYGAALFTADDFFAIPGFLLEDVRDPTGAGDSFAGGLPGLSRQGRARRATRRSTADALRQAMAYGTVLASFNVEDFGTSRVSSLTDGRDRAAPRSDFKRITASSRRRVASRGGRGGSSAARTPRSARRRPRA